MSHDKIENIVTVDCEGEYFNRSRIFKIRRVEYKIEWWVNVGYLFVGEMMICFDDMNISGTWPNKYKSSINFKYFGNTVCVLPVEEY